MDARKLIVWLMLIVWVGCSQLDLYFVLTEGKERCFLEDVPKDTLVVGRYEAEAEGLDTYKSGIIVVATDADGNVVYTREMKTKGKFAFTTQVQGEHRICIKTNSTGGWFSSKAVKMRLDIESGSKAADYGDIAKSEHLSSLEVQVRVLNDRVRDVRSLQSYMRGREAVFRNTSESTNSRVMWWSVLQVLVLIGVSLWQITHLKSFFKAKKLV